MTKSKTEVALSKENNVAVLTTIEQNSGIQRILADGVVGMMSNDNFDIKALQGIVEIQQKINDKQSEQIFYQELSKMCSEIPMIVNTKKGQTGAAKFKYAPLNTIMEAVSPFLKKYEFVVFHTDLDDGGLKTTLAHSSGYKIHKSFKIQQNNVLPKGNDFQQAGAKQTYMMRYNIIPLLTLIFTDMDDEGVFYQNENYNENTKKEAEALAKEQKASNEKKKQARKKALVSAIDEAQKEGTLKTYTFGTKSETLATIIDSLIKMQQDGNDFWDDCIEKYKGAIYDSIDKDEAKGEAF